MDYNSDGRVDVYDVVVARQKGVSKKELNDLADFVLGKKKYDTEFTIDESSILEPKGTVHTGEGTFYGGGYVGAFGQVRSVGQVPFPCTLPYQFLQIVGLEFDAVQLVVTA